MVVETTGSLTHVGRFDTEDETGLHLLDVGTHDAAGGGSKEDYLRRSVKFGIRTDRPHLVVPRPEVARITRLVDLES